MGAPAIPTGYRVVSREPAPAAPPPVPAGYSVVATPDTVAAPLASRRPLPGSLAPITATGAVHDGDTFRLNTGANGRLFGVDAFELNQTGRAPDGSVIPLGRDARSAFAPMAYPGAPVRAVGPTTYGRPVVTLGPDGKDAGHDLLREGWALAEPKYLKADPTRFQDYMEAERLARLNGLGAHGNTFVTPSQFRHDPWAKAEWSDAKLDGPATAVFKDEPTPFQGLRPEIAAGYLAIGRDPKSSAADLRAYAAENGFSPGDVESFVEKRNAGAKVGDHVDYVQPPRVLTDPGDGRFGAVAWGYADPINMLDEQGGLLDTLGLTAGRENLFNSDRRFGDIWANNVDQNRSILDHDEAEHPWMRFGGQLASGLTFPGLSVEGVGFNAARAAIRSGATRAVAEQAAQRALVGRLAKIGAGEGALAGAGQGETWGERAQDAAIGAPLGATLGVGTGFALPAAYNAVAPYLKQAGRKLLGRPGSLAPADAPLPAHAEAFGQGMVTGAEQAPRSNQQGDARRLPGGVPTPFDPLADLASSLHRSAPPPQIADVLAAATTPGNTHAVAPVGKVGAWLAARGKEAGLDIAGYDHAIDSSAVRHVMKNHGDVVTEAQRGQIAVTPADFHAVPDVVHAPDKVVFGTNSKLGRDQVAYIKRMDDGSTLVVEEVRTGRKQLALNSMRKYPPTTNADSIAATLYPNAQSNRGTALKIFDRLTGRKGASENRDAEYATATLTGPAAPTGGVSSVIAAAPDAQVRAQSAGVQSKDVLPLPANTVDGLDEAARIEAGRAVPVKAPNEREALSGQPIPSAKSGAPLRHVGPLDLVTWLRTHGGLKPDGGELAHSGIGNAPRKGMDFTGREGSYGPLVSEHGMHLDDAAEAATSAGYFDQRPDVWEFMDAVKETHAGRNRVFHPDDLNQIADFEAQRSQRHAVENAAQEGAPLFTDKSQPIDMADLDRNAAPVEAYHEWGENAPHRAGNIDLSKLDSPEAIKRAIVSTHQRVGGFDEATRGRITHAETKSLAADLGMTADNLLARRKGQALNAEEALAARQILARSSTDLVNMARRMARIENPGDELEASFKEAWLRHVAVQEQVAGMTAEAGRALSAFRAVADSRGAGGRVLPTLGDMPGGAARMKDVAARIIDMEQSGVGPGGIAQFAAKSLWARKRDMALEYYYNAMLSGPQTHAVNILSNTLTALGQIPEHLVAAGIGSVRRVAEKGASKLIGRDVGNADRVLFSETGSRAVGMMQGAREGLREASRTFLTGQPSDGVTKLELASQRAIPGVAGSIIRTPTRALAAEDEFFKAVARRMAINGLATRKAGLEGLKGKASRERIADLTGNPTDEMLDAAHDYGRYLTFQAPLGQAGQAVGKFTEALPLAKLVVPFTRTPVNILKFAVERSPAAPLLGEWRREIMAGGARRDTALARLAVGSGVAALVVQMAAEGHITGGGPADDSAKRLLQADGWQPYSFKIGDKYYSYSRLDPYAMTLGTAADLVDVQSAMTEKQHERAATLVAASVAKNLANKTWLSGISGLVEAINDPDRSMEKFLSNTVASMVVPAAVSQIARTTDPVLREARGPIDTIRSRIPGASTDLKPMRDVFGQEVKREGGVGPDIGSPVWKSTAKNDPVVKALLDAGVSIGKPQQRKMSAADFDNFQSQAGVQAYIDLQTLIGSPEWKAASNADRDDMADRAVTKARKTVRESMFGVPARRLPGALAPASGGVPALPPGYVLDAPAPLIPPGYRIVER